MDSGLPICLRKAAPDDFDMVYQTWIKSNLKSPLSIHMPKDIHTEYEKVVILKLLDNGAEILIACSPTLILVPYAYICTQKIEGKVILHYVYVRQAYRKHGISNLLLQRTNAINDGEIYCTHLPRPSLLHVFSKKYKLTRLPIIV